MTDEFLTVHQVARRLGCSESTLYERRKQGLFPQPIKMGELRSSPVKWPASQVEEWIEKNGPVVDKRFKRKTKPKPKPKSSDSKWDLFQWVPAPKFHQVCKMIVNHQELADVFGITEFDVLEIKKNPYFEEGRAPRHLEMFAVTIMKWNQSMKLVTTLNAMRFDIEKAMDPNF